MVKAQTDEWVEDNGATTQPTPDRSTAGGNDWVEDDSWAPDEAGGKKKWGPFEYDPAKNDFKNKGVLKTLGNEVTKAPDESAKAMLKSMGYLGGLVSDAGMEGIKRFASLGQEGLGADEWSKALHGEATPATEQLKKAGYGPAVQYGAGLPYSVLTDPLAGMFSSGDIGMTGLKRMAQGAAEKPTAMEALTQTAAGSPGDVPAGSQPIGNIIQRLGKKIYGAPFKKVDAEISTKYKNAGGEAHPFTKQLWNEGNPLVGGYSKTNPEIGEQITGLRKATGSDIGNRIAAAGGDEEVHLAPELRDNAKSAMIESMPEPVLTGPQEEALKLLPPDVQGPAKAKILAQAKADIAKNPPDEMEWLKSQIASKNKDQRAMAIRILADSAPDLSGVIESNAKHLANSGSRPGVIAFYNGLIDDLSEGSRNLEGLQDLKVSMQDAAAKNQQMGANQYANNSMPNKAKSADVQAAADIGKVIDEIVDSHLGTEAVSAPDKARYSALRRGEWPAWRVIQSQQARPALSKLDLLLGLGGASQATHHPGTVASILAAKTLDEMRRSPRFATGTGKLLNSAAKSNLWDNMLRRGALNSALSNNGGNQ